MDTTAVMVLWICWCSMHSILIDFRVTQWVKRCLPGLLRYYRLLYNGLSLFTLWPLVTYTREADGEVLFSWQGWGVSVRILLLLSALILFWSGAQRYDIRSFLGITQLKAGQTRLLLSTSCDFLPIGVFGITRHPWYLGSLFCIWTLYTEYSIPVFCAAIILSLYLVVGSQLEERKIIREYGNSYRRYQQQVSMLFPWKWLKTHLKL